MADGAPSPSTTARSTAGAGTLRGARVAFLVTDGFEQVELTQPWLAVEQAGGRPELVAPAPGQVQGFHHHDKGDVFSVDATACEADPGDYAAIVLPGGVINPDALRTDEAATGFVRRFVDAGKPVAAVCHGPWRLVEVGAVTGRTVTSWPSLRTDLVNAGGTWVDREVVVDGNLITSRNPDDLPAFAAALVDAVGRATGE
jgi:protease I